ETRRLMIVAGEASGDAHAASLVDALRAANPDVQFEFFGATGPLMRATGVESVVRTDDLSILGLVEIAGALPKFWQAFKLLKQAAIEKNPAAVILVDWPDFNLKLARALHRRGLKIIYYISPQLWAWRSYRIHTLRRDVDLMLSILPFEPDWFAQRGMMQVEYVGNPLAGKVHARYDREEFSRLNHLNPSRPIVALLPGSRHNEITNILPPMLDAAALISRVNTQVQFTIVVAPGRSPDEAAQIIAARKTDPSLPAILKIIENQTREALAAADVAAIASGTATLEAGLLGTPMVVVYKESAINWQTLGRLTHPDHYGLVNLLSGRRMMTELIQNELTGERLATEIISLLEPKRNHALRLQLRELAQSLGDSDASRLAAERVLATISRVEVAEPQRAS